MCVYNFVLVRCTLVSFTWVICRRCVVNWFAGCSRRWSCCYCCCYRMRMT